MTKRILVCLLAVVGVCAGQPVSNRYALVLSDPPVARFSGDRAAYRQRIRDSHLPLKKAVAARGLIVTGEVDTLLNAVFVAATPDRVVELAAIPGVAHVVPLRSYKLDLNRAVTLVDASGAWNALGGVANAGLGIKIAILDTGIDQTHAAFQDAALVAPGGYPKCSGSDCAFTSNKVIVARSYVKMLAAGSSAADSRPDDFSPRDHTGHGTAVASVAAGNTSTGLLTITGMAPHAFLGNYRIFGSPEVNDSTTDDVIIAAAEDAIKDGMDIISLSLGAPAFFAPSDTGAICGQPAGTACDILSSTLETAAQAGTIIVVAAGNNGQTGTSTPGYNTIASPGDAPSVITVGASTNSHAITASVTVPGTSQNFAAYLGNGNNSTVTAPAVDVNTLGSGPLACGSLPSGSLSGSIALIERGTCTFLIKLQNAQAAGAVGVIFYMADGSTPIYPGGLGGTTIPAAMVSNADGSSLVNGGGQKVSINNSLGERLLTVYNQLAGFSSQGPSIGTNGLKPDLVAVGTNMYMAAETYDPLGAVYSATGYASASGTSFAAPMVAGAAAMVKQSHPGWTAAQIKSALVNSATTDVTTDDSGNSVTALSIGAGKLDAGAAVAASVTASPATISFGQVPPLSAKQILLTNNGSASVTLAINNDNSHGAPGVLMGFSSSSLTLAPGASTNLVVTLSGSTPGGGAYSGAVTVTGTNVSLRIPYLYLVPTGVAANLIAMYGDAHDGTVGETTYVLFKVVDANGLPVANASSRFKASSGAQIIAATSVTNSYGIAEAEVFVGLATGPYTITASSGGLTYVFTGTARATPVVSGVANAASANVGTPVAPGSYVAITGSALSDVTDLAATLRLPLALDFVNVSFDVPSAGISVPGHLYYVSPSQINVQVPWELAGQPSAQMKVIIDYTYSNVFTVSLADYAPAFFEYAPGQVSALDLNYNLIGPSNPALRGQTIQLYANGLGPVMNTPASGDPASSTSLTPTTTQPTVTIGGQFAQTSYCGLAPGLVGLYQINVTVPGGLTPGVQPLVVSIGGVSSKASGILVQ